MRDLFPGWTPPDEATLTQYWDEATFAVDTSVLLDLYRFSREARSDLLEALRSFGERLWVPHQVAYEFHRNRLGVLLAQREAEDALLGELGQIRGEIDDQLSKRLRGAGRRDLAPLREAINGGFDRLREKLEEAEREHTEGLGDSIRDDPIYDEVEALCGEQIGEAFSESRMAEARADAEERLRRKIPPGYLDAEKDGDARFGDVIIWHQLCEKAAASEKPIVLIADDQKADWIWEVRGKTLGPRPELVAEMRERAGVGFHIYTPVRLLEVWEEREEGREVEEAVLDEIKAPSPITEASSGEPMQDDLAAGFQSVFEGWAKGIVAESDHRRTEDSLELILAFKARTRHDFPSAVGVKVTNPVGQVFFHGVPTADVPGRQAVVVRYPDHFEEESRLMSGRYSVQWFAFVPGKSGLEMSRWLPRESFVLPEDSAG